MPMKIKLLVKGGSTEPSKTLQNAALNSVYTAG